MKFINKLAAEAVYFLFLVWKLKILNVCNQIFIIQAIYETCEFKIVSSLSVMHTFHCGAVEGRKSCDKKHFEKAGDSLHKLLKTSSCPLNFLFYIQCHQLCVRSLALPGKIVYFFNHPYRNSKSCFWSRRTCMTSSYQ